jgi:hypothetical protein
LVSGVLQLSDAPTLQLREQSVSFVQSRIQVTSPGTIRFRLDNAEGMEVRIDGVPVPSEAEFSAELSAGPHVLTLTVDRLRRTGGLQLELLDVEGPGGGNAEWVN